MSRAESSESVITLEGDPDGEVQHLLKRLSALPGVIETDYHLLTRKLIVRYDPKVLTHSRIIEEIEWILHGHYVDGKSEALGEKIRIQRYSGSIRIEFSEATRLSG